MNKYAEVFCKQNPVIKMKCGNPECENELEIKSKEFFHGETYSCTCERCGKSTEYDTSKFADELESQLKKLGIKVK